jgi:hypothetical protein
VTNSTADYYNRLIN